MVSAFQGSTVLWIGWWRGRGVIGIFCLFYVTRLVACEDHYYTVIRDISTCDHMYGKAIDDIVGVLHTVLQHQNYCPPPLSPLPH